MKAIYLLWPIRVPFWGTGAALLGLFSLAGMDVDWERFWEDALRALGLESPEKVPNLVAVKGGKNAASH